MSTTGNVIKKKTPNGCKVTARTILIDGEHRFKGTNNIEHNHSPEVSNAIAAQALAQMKAQASTTKNSPAVIIQNVTSEMSHVSAQALPSRDAMRQQIKRVRRQSLPAEPTSLRFLEIPEELKRTIDGENFLAKEISIQEDKILIFTTSANVQKLSQASFWLMDGTFKTVPTIFSQLYSIHAPFGNENSNSRIVPLVFALLSRKTKDCYVKLFQGLHDYAEQSNLVLRPKAILTDFEQAAILAIKQEFDNTNSRLCLFHFGQNIWRQVQSCGLVHRYGEDEEFSLMIKHLLALAFLPATEIVAAFEDVKELTCSVYPEAAQLVKWFEETYVLGKIRRILQDGTVNRSEPIFPPDLWSVNVDLGEDMPSAMPRTQNNVEAWHRRWEVLVGTSHVGLYRLIQELQKEQKNTELVCESVVKGEPRPKQRKKDELREKRIQNVISSRSSVLVMNFLRGIAYNLSL